MTTTTSKENHEAKQICCSEKDKRPLYECQHSKIIFSSNLFRGEIVDYTFERCRNLMHADCIEKHGKCHENSEVREFRRPN